MTAGNSSGINDGAVALLVASERAVARYGLQPVARIGSGVVVGVPPRVMGIVRRRRPASCSTGPV